MPDYHERPAISFNVFNDDDERYWITCFDLLTTDPGCTCYFLTCVGGFQQNASCSATKLCKHTRQDYSQLKPNQWQLSFFVPSGCELYIEFVFKHPSVYYYVRLQ